MSEPTERTGKISPDYGLHCNLDPIVSHLKNIDFPISKKDLLAKVGHDELPCSGGDRHTLKELLEPLTKEQYNSIRDIQDAMEHPVRMAHHA
jgi:hypothetical protein